jgi:hypothetical protein
MTMHKGRMLAGTLVMLLALGAPASAQFASSIEGTVTDPSGGVVPGATVTILNESTGDARAVATDARGDFQVTNLQPGTYTARVELESFRTLERKNIVLSAGARLSIGTLRLEVGSLGETVTVEARGTQVNTSETQHSGVITATQIEQTQVLGRDVTSIMRLLPGVRYEQTVDSLGMSFGTSVPNVGGARRDWSNVIVDGVIANEVGNSGLMAQQINLDAVSEVVLLLNSYRAEYGRAGGGQLQIVSKSGTTNYRGNLYYYGRHEMLNATNFFINRAQAQKPRYRFNTYGANLGGPVPGAYKGEKKLFFFYSMEAPIVNRPGPLRNWMMPTEAERRGDFSQTLDSQGRLIHIRDPQREGTCHAVNGGPACFPGNVIPSNRINPNGLALLNMLPIPTNFDRTSGNQLSSREVAERGNITKVLNERSAQGRGFPNRIEFGRLVRPFDGDARYRDGPGAAVYIRVGPPGCLRRAFHRPALLPAASVHDPRLHPQPPSVRPARSANPTMAGARRPPPHGPAPREYLCSGRVREKL